MVVGKVARQFDFCSQIPQPLFEALRSSYAAQGTDIKLFEIVERQLLIFVNVPEIERSVAAFNDLCRTIVTPNPLNEVVVGFAVAFRDENVACAPEVPRRFAQCAPW